MTVMELSAVYQDSANRLRDRIGALRVALKTEEDPDEAARLRRRIAELLPMWQETRDTAKLLAGYYGGGKDAKKRDQH